MKVNSSSISLTSNSAPGVGGASGSFSAWSFTQSATVCAQYSPYAPEIHAIYLQFQGFFLCIAYLIGFGGIAFLAFVASVALAT
jgi:hypothetical protein